MDCGAINPSTNEKERTQGGISHLVLVLPDVGSRCGCNRTMHCKHHHGLQQWVLLVWEGLDGIQPVLWLCAYAAGNTASCTLVYSLRIGL